MALGGEPVDCAAQSFAFRQDGWTVIALPRLDGHYARLRQARRLASPERNAALRNSSSARRFDRAHLIHDPAVPLRPAVGGKIEHPFPTVPAQVEIGFSEDELVAQRASLGADPPVRIDDD